MNYFNVAADFKKETIDKYCELNQRYPNAKVFETFGQVSINNTLGSGRPGDMMPVIDFTELADYVSYSNSKGIGFSYTLNAMCLSNREFTEEGLKEINTLLSNLSDIGVKSMTVAIPPIIDFIKRSNFNFEVKASTLCDITNANKALAYKELGADRIVVHESINREFDILKNIRDVFGSDTEIIVNVICHKNCIFRPFHQIQGSHNTESDVSSPRYYGHKCMQRRANGIENYLKLNWIRPEDLKYYNQIGINKFKIQGRHSVVEGNPVKTAECYMKESFDGNLMDLLDMFKPASSFPIHIDNKKLEGFIEPYFKHKDFCKNVCSKCNHCLNYAKKSMDVEKSEEISILMRRFYGEFDDFTALVNKVNNIN